MRITPLICSYCRNWFLPKTMRPQRYCCNACRQQGHLHIKENPNYYQEGEPMHFNTGGDAEATKRLYDAFQSACDKGLKNCAECLMKNDFETYRELTYLYGRDRWNKSAQEWLSETALEGA